MNNLRKFIAVTFLGVMLSASAWAQTVKGTVTDAQTGETLIGVNVVVRGTQNGASTDINGSYTLQDVATGATLTFSYIGYETVSVAVGGRSQIDVKMAQAANEMDEMVVVGYQALKRRDVLGAVSNLDGETMSAVPVSNTEQALQGRIAGVQVSAATGTPGADVSVRVRGVGSVFSDNSPLYIIDGIPSSTGMRNLSPSDIENITVLKDAASAAIYGSRATNGVVLVTTRQGKEGKAKITYNGTVSAQTAINLVKMVNTADYVKIYNEATAADNVGVGTGLQRAYITDDMLPALADVNHVDEIFQTAPSTSHELQVSGGGEKMRYLVSATYLNQKGIIRNSGYQRGTFRANLSSKVRPWLELGANVSGSLSEQKLVSDSGDGYGNDQGGSVVRYAMFRNPAIPIYNNAGEYVDKPSTYFGKSVYDTFFGDGYSPEGLSEYTDRTRSCKNLFAKLNARFIIFKDLSINTNFGVDYRDYEQKVYNRCWGDDNRINNPNSLVVAKEDNLNWTFNLTANYNHTWGDHSFNALAGFEANRETGNTTNLSDQNFEIWDKELIYIGGGTPTSATSTTNVKGSTGRWAATLASFFAQANYDYKARYYLNATIREDGTSRFVGDNRWGTFYSVGAGWDITREPFMERQDVLHLLKLRVGYGAIGNQNVGLYAYSDRYARNYNYYVGSGSANGYVQTVLGNANLKWETSKQLNVGLDFSFLRGALAFSVDFFNKTTDNMLMQASYPLSVGQAQAPWINSGKVLNRGIDFEAVYRLRRKDWNFTATLNGGWLHNEVLEMNAPVQGGRVDNGVYATRTAVGQPVGAFYMYVMDGIFQNNMEILTSAYQGKGIQPGDVKFKDVNGDGVIDANDREYVGSAIPKFTLGLNLAAEWKGFDLSLFFQGTFGQKVYNQILTDCEGFYRGFTVTQRYFDNHWTPTNPSNEYPRAAWTGKANNARVSTRFLEDGSYMRLKNITLGYTFDTKTWGIDRLRLYASVSNVFTITGYSGFDPEMTVSANSSSEGDRANGIDWGTYPAARTYTFGVNLTF